MKPQPAECTLAVRVTPRSSRNKIEITSDGSASVWVTASPTDGQANQAICELVADKLGMAKSAVSVVSGHKARVKKLHVAGLVMDEVMARLGAK